MYVVPSSAAQSYVINTPLNQDDYGWPPNVAYHTQPVYYDDSHDRIQRFAPAIDKHCIQSTSSAYGTPDVQIGQACQHRPTPEFHGLHVHDYCIPNYAPHLQWRQWTPLSPDPSPQKHFTPPNYEAFPQNCTPVRTMGVRIPTVLATSNAPSSSAQYGFQQQPYQLQPRQLQLHTNRIRLPLKKAADCDARPEILWECDNSASAMNLQRFHQYPISEVRYGLAPNVVIRHRVRMPGVVTRPHVKRIGAAQAEAASVLASLSSPQVPPRPKFSHQHQMQQGPVFVHPSPVESVWQHAKTPPYSTGPFLPTQPFNGHQEHAWIRNNNGHDLQAGGRAYANGSTYQPVNESRFSHFQPAAESAPLEKMAMFDQQKPIQVIRPIQKPETASSMLVVNQFVHEFIRQMDMATVEKCEPPKTTEVFQRHSDSQRYPPDLQTAQVDRTPQKSFSTSMPVMVQESMEISPLQPVVSEEKFAREEIVDTKMQTKGPKKKRQLKTRQTKVRKVGRPKIVKKLVVKATVSKAVASKVKKLKIAKRTTVASVVPELQMPKITNADPLSLSVFGVLSLLAQNATGVRRRKRGKLGEIFKVLPAFFGPVAASLLLRTRPVETSGTTAKNGHLKKEQDVWKEKMQTANVEPAYPTADRIVLADGSLETEDRLRNRLENNITQPVDQCTCVSQVNEDVEGPYYTHLAAAESVEKMRVLLEERYGERGPAIRIEKVSYTGKEGKTPDGCPIAKWIIRRSGPAEKVLCVVRCRPGHHCATAVIAVAIVMWEGVPGAQADDLYDYLINVLPSYGVATNRRCETNEKRLCACQGANALTGGASFSFGCSWSMYSNTCKFVKSKYEARRFKLQKHADLALEEKLEDKCHKLADVVAPSFKRIAPACYRNQTYYSDIAQPCRLGYVPRGPFSGITACVDFCAHAHKDTHNMNNGCTVVVTLTKYRGFEKPADEQLHVLPMCILDSTDEFDSEEGLWRKAENGSLEILGTYPMNLRLRTKPLPCSKERTKQLKQKGRQKQATDFSNDDGNEPLTNHAAHNFVNGFASPCRLPDTYLQPVQADQQPKQMLPPFETFSSSAAFSHHGQLNDCAYPHLTSQEVFQVPPMSTNGYASSSSFYDLAQRTQGIRYDAIGTPPPPKTDGIYMSYTENHEAFADSQMGGVALALTHGSVLFEVAKRELHATTALKTPDRRDPKRISLVFYQHKLLNYTSHGSENHEKWLAEKNKTREFGERGAGENGKTDSDEEEEDDGNDFASFADAAPPSPPEWKLTGAKLCSSIVRDKLTTATSANTFHCRVTQKYGASKTE